jgi:hypothetical protein
MTHGPEELRVLLERHQLALARLHRALEAGGSGGSAELESFTAEWDAVTARLSPDERRAVVAFLEELIALDADERAS